MKKITRREFMKKASLAAAGGFAALSLPSASAQMRGGGGSMGGGTTVIDPPPGAEFADPVPVENFGSLPGLVEVNLEAGVTPVNLNGVTANLFTYNGHYPAPTITVKRGDRLRVKLTNMLPATGETNLLGYQRNITNLHTHGWHVSPEPPGDYVMYGLKHGESYQHEYDTSLQPGGTLNFYHPHKHGVSAEQYWAGLAGALIVEDETDALAGYETHLMVLKDISLAGPDPAPHATMMDFMHGKEGNIIMVNGRVNPVLRAEPGQTQRWRILNASSARFYKLSLSNHMMHLIGTDGGLLDKPYQTSQLLLSPGERVDVLVRASTTKGNYRLLALPYSHRGNMLSEQITLMTLFVRRSGTDGQALPVAINQDASKINLNAIAISAERTLTLSMGQGNAYINGQDFDVDPYTIMSRTGTYEVWTIANQSGMDHPFHQHVNSAQILAMRGADPSYPRYAALPAWKDTVLVPKWGSVSMLVPVADYTGMAMFHCHILEHEDIGMMGMWHIMPGEMPMP